MKCQIHPFISRRTVWPHPGQHEASTQCWFNVGPASTAEIDFRSQNLTPVDVRFWRLKSNLAVDSDPTLNQHWVNVWCLLGSHEGPNCSSAEGQEAVTAHFSSIQVSSGCILALLSSDIWNYTKLYRNIRKWHVCYYFTSGSHKQFYSAKPKGSNCLLVK